MALKYKYGDSNVSFCVESLCWRIHSERFFQGQFLFVLFDNFVSKRIMLEKFVTTFAFGFKLGLLTYLKGGDFCLFDARSI